MPFTKGHPRYTKKLHKFSPSDRNKSHIKARENGHEGGKGTKRPNRTGPKHHNWKGGYKNKLHHNLIRRIMMRGVGGTHTFAQWENLKAQYNWTCPCCKEAEPKIKLTKDHIIPIIKGGSNNIENIQPLCFKCNRDKYTNIIKY